MLSEPISRALSALLPEALPGSDSGQKSIWFAMKIGDTEVDFYVVSWGFKLTENLLLRSKEFEQAYLF